MKILIVDDEMPIKEYIAHCIKSASEEEEIVGSVSSGKEALRFLERNPVELVFIDITMPKMSGMELLKLICASYPQIYTVMLTCHDDFSFVREAMQLGASDYILKNELEPKSIQDLLERIRKKRLREHPEHIVKSRISFIKYLNTVLADKDADLLDGEAIREYLLGYSLSNYFVCIFYYRKDLLDELARLHFFWIKRQWIFPMEEGKILLLINIIPEIKKSRQQSYREALRSFFDRESGYPAGMSSVYFQENMLKRAVLEAKRDLSKNFYRGEAKRESVGDEDALKQIFRYRNAAITALASNDIKNFKDQMQELFDFAAVKQVQAEQLKRVICFIAEISAENEEAARVLLARIIHTANISQLREIFEEFMRDLDKTKETYSEHIEKAISFIKKNYHHNIGLNEAAKEAFLNTEYFSRRFKKEVGINFSEYLLTLRMQEAKRLLKTSSKQIKEVAKLVGIGNVSYFTSLYKKQFGITPAESRRNKEGKIK